MEDVDVEWRVRAIRGATTVSENTVEAIRAAVMELLDELEVRNQIDPTQIISATFSVTNDLDAAFPSAIARREREHWDNVALFDMQQMHIEGGMERCIRLLIHVNLPVSQTHIYHPYLRQANTLRPDRSLPQALVPRTPAVQSRLAIRGATTVSENTVEAIRAAVMELLDELEVRNQIDPTQIISATFSVTRDLDAIFPSAIARRERRHWDDVALFDVQQMYVEGSLERCIRLLIHVNLPVSHAKVWHPYLRQAKTLRPDWSSAQTVAPRSPAVR